MFGSFVGIASDIQTISHNNKIQKIEAQKLLLQKEKLDNELETKDENQSAFNNAVANTTKTTRDTLSKRPKMYTTTQQQYMM
jgi:hypothetical protein